MTVSSYQQDADKEMTNMIWMVIAIFSITMAILLAISGITMGAVLCRISKSVITTSGSKLTTHQQGIYKYIQYNLFKHQLLDLVINMRLVT